MQMKRKQSRGRWSRTEKLMLLAIIMNSLFQVLDLLFK